MNNQDALDAAQAIRPHLPALIGNEAEQLARELDELIRLAENGDDVRLPIMAALRQREATREWAQRLLDTPPTHRTYERLPGRAQIATAPPKYVCPLNGEGHEDYIWFRFSKADQPPWCEVHQTQFVLASS